MNPDCDPDPGTVNSDHYENMSSWAEARKQNAKITKKNWQIPSNSDKADVVSPQL